MEQFLGGFLHEQGPAVRWLALRRKGRGVAVLLHEALDDGHLGCDIYEFTALNDDPDKLYDPTAKHRCDTLEQALDLAAKLYGASPDRFVNEGLIQDEYQDFVAGRRVGP
ncbi:MAG TPA: hypothetical protein VF615_03710 [Longimicrobiaceae bacterium]